MKDIAAAITRTRTKIIGWSILSIVVSLILVFVVLPVVLSTDPMTVLVAIVCFVTVGLVSIWADRRFTRQHGNVPRGYV